MRFFIVLLILLVAGCTATVEFDPFKEKGKTKTEKKTEPVKPLFRPLPKY